MIGQLRKRILTAILLVFLSADGARAIADNIDILSYFKEGDSYKSRVVQAHTFPQVSDSQTMPTHSLHRLNIPSVQRYNQKYRQNFKRWQQENFALYPLPKEKGFYGKLDKQQGWKESMKRLKEAAKQNDPEAEYFLGTFLLAEGKPKEARALWEKSANQGFADAQYSLGNLYAKKGKVDEARELWQKSAKQGFMHAQYRWGYVLFEENKHEEAKKWWEKAALQGHFGSQSLLAAILFKEGKKQEGRKWLIKAAEGGVVKSQHALASILKQEGDIKQAKIWYEKAAKKGYADSQNNLANILKSEGNIEEAVSWYLKASISGNRFAQYNLGVLKLEQENKPKEAREWFHASANQGYALAQSRLGSLLYEEKNKSKAKYWWEKAAKQGLPQGQTGLGVVLYEEGKFKEARKWWKKAAIQGDKEASSNLKLLNLGKSLKNNGLQAEKNIVTAIEFKKIKTSERLEGLIKEKFPLGLDGNKAKELLEKSGSKCVFFQNKEQDSLTSSPTLKKEIPTKVGWYKLTPSHRFLIHRQCQRILSTDLISHQSNGTTRSIDKTSNVGNKKISPYIPYLKRRGFTASWINYTNNSQYPQRLVMRKYEKRILKNCVMWLQVAL